MVAISVTYGGYNNEVDFSAQAAPSEVERAVCVACSVAWGSVFSLVDADGVHHVVDNSLSDGSQLDLQLVSKAESMSLGTTVKTINVVEPDTAELVPECKVLLVGDGSVGKSSFVASLLMSREGCLSRPSVVNIPVPVSLPCHYISTMP